MEDPASIETPEPIEISRRRTLIGFLVVLLMLVLAGFGGHHPVIGKIIWATVALQLLAVLPLLGHHRANDIRLHWIIAIPFFILAHFIGEAPLVTCVGAAVSLELVALSGGWIQSRITTAAGRLAAAIFFLASGLIGILLWL